MRLHETKALPFTQKPGIPFDVGLPLHGLVVFLPACRQFGPCMQRRSPFPLLSAHKPQNRNITYPKPHLESTTASVLEV